MNKPVSLAEQSDGTREEPFSLTVDRYGRLWLHAKLDGLQVAFDLAQKDAAFEIMSTTMIENGFEFSPAPGHDPADNDDEVGS
jgi:hypothetical protein